MQQTPSFIIGEIVDLLYKVFIKAEKENISEIEKEMIVDYLTEAKKRIDNIITLFK